MADPKRMHERLMDFERDGDGVASLPKHEQDAAFSQVVRESQRLEMADYDRLMTFPKLVKPLLKFAIDKLRERKATAKVDKRTFTSTAFEQVQFLAVMIWAKTILGGGISLRGLLDTAASAVFLCAEIGRQIEANWRIKEKKTEKDKLWDRRDAANMVMEGYLGGEKETCGYLKQMLVWTEKGAFMLHDIYLVEDIGSDKLIIGQSAFRREQIVQYCHKEVATIVPTGDAAYLNKPMTSFEVRLLTEHVANREAAKFKCIRPKKLKMVEELPFNQFQTQLSADYDYSDKSGDEDAQPPTMKKAPSTLQKTAPPPITKKTFNSAADDRLLKNPSVIAQIPLLQQQRIQQQRHPLPPQQKQQLKQPLLPLPTLPFLSSALPLPHCQLPPLPSGMHLPPPNFHFPSNGAGGGPSGHLLQLKHSHHWDMGGQETSPPPMDPFSQRHQQQKKQNDRPRANFGRSAFSGGGGAKDYGDSGRSTAGGNERGSSDRRHSSKRKHRDRSKSPPSERERDRDRHSSKKRSKRSRSPLMLGGVGRSEAAESKGSGESKEREKGRGGANERSRRSKGTPSSVESDRKKRGMPKRAKDGHVHASLPPMDPFSQRHQQQKQQRDRPRAIVGRSAFNGGGGGKDYGVSGRPTAGGDERGSSDRRHSSKRKHRDRSKSPPTDRERDRDRHSSKKRSVESDRKTLGMPSAPKDGHVLDHD